jgi:hypothetical protein
LIKETGHADDSQTALSVPQEKETTNIKRTRKDENKDALVQARCSASVQVYSFSAGLPSLPLTNFHDMTPRYYVV